MSSMSTKPGCNNHWPVSRRIDNMVAVFLPDERTDLVYTDRLGHVWDARNWPVSKPFSELTARMSVILATIGYHNYSFTTTIKFYVFKI